MSSERHATVAGLGSVLPDRVVPNACFESFVETSDEWIRERTGIARAPLRGRRTRPRPTSRPTPPGGRWRPPAIAAGADRSHRLRHAHRRTRRSPRPPSGSSASSGSLPRVRRERRLRGLLLRPVERDRVHRVGPGRDRAGDGRRGALARDRTSTTGRRACCSATARAPWCSGDRRSPACSGRCSEPTARAAEILIIPGGGSAEPASRRSVAAGAHPIHMPNGREVFKRAVVEMAERVPRAAREVGVHARTTSTC